MRKDRKYRFTLQFSANSEEQIRVGELLEKLGNSVDVAMTGKAALEMFTPGEYEATAQGFAGAVTVKVTVDEAYTLGNAFKVMGNNSFCYLLMVITGLSYLTILVLIALIINSLRKSIRDEQPLRHSNILRTRAIGILILVGELSEAFMKYLNNNEAVRLLEGTSFEVVQTFPLSYWNVIVGILFLFMAEVLSLGTQLSEEQKLTI